MRINLEFRSAIRQIFWVILLLGSLHIQAQVGINTRTPNPLSALDVESITTPDKGLIIPRMTKAQRDAIVLTQDAATGGQGLIIYNTDEDCFNYYNKTYNNGAGTWQSLCGGQGKADIVPPPCTSQSVSGRYFRGVTVDGSKDYLTLQVNVLTPGSYSILATPANNDTYAFATSGTFIAAGLNTITVPCSGTPQISGLSQLNITVNGSINGPCTNMVVLVEDFVPSYDTYGCALPGSNGQISVNGVYTTGRVTSGANSVTLSLQVPATDTNAPYNIVTTAVPDNGIKYSGSGTLGPIAGPQTVTLYASGTPVNVDTGAWTDPGTAGHSKYTIQSNSSVNGGVLSCSFGVLVGGPPSYTYACGTPTVQGTYVVGVPLDPNTNTITMPITYDGTLYGGKTYNIVTTTANGMTFSAVGNLPSGTVTSTLNVILRGSGTPTSAAEGVTNVLVGTWNSIAPIPVCSIPVTTIALRYSISSPPTITGTTRTALAGTTYDGTNGYLFNSTFPGAYVLNQPLTAANTITVPVKINAGAGLSMVITTTAANGMTFSSVPYTVLPGDIGTTKNIVLTGTGTPTALGATTINITTNSLSDKGETTTATVSTNVVNKTLTFMSTSGTVAAYTISTYNGLPVANNAWNGGTTFMFDPGNFGTLSTSTFPQNGWKSIYYNNPYNGALKNYINNYKPDILVLSWEWTPTPADAQIIATYLAAGGIVFDCNQGDVDVQNELTKVLGKALTVGGTNNDTYDITYNTFIAGVHKYNSAAVGDPILDGPYGKLAATPSYWGDDVSQTYSVKNSSLPAGYISYSSDADLSNATSALPSGRSTSFRLTNVDYVWCGDGGFLSSYWTTTNTWEYNNQTGYPGWYHTVGGVVLPELNGAGGGAGYGYGATKFKVANSVFFANFLNWAAGRVVAKNYPISNNPGVIIP